MKAIIWSEENSDEEGATELHALDDYDLEREVEKYASADHAESDYWVTATFCVRVDGGPVRRFLVSAVPSVDFLVVEVSS